VILGAPNVTTDEILKEIVIIIIVFSVYEFIRYIINKKANKKLQQRIAAV